MKPYNERRETIRSIACVGWMTATMAAIVVIVDML